MREHLSFDDVLLRPQLGVIAKREHADISAWVTPGFKIDVPILSAPMTSVTESAMAVAMWRAGALGILHRFMDIQRMVIEYQVIKAQGAQAGAAIGIKEDYTRWKWLDKIGCPIVVLDVAHAHHVAIEEFLSNAPQHLRDRGNLIVGNVATAEGAEFLLDLGVNGIKVGIGPGAACQTREVTGFGVPQLSAIMEVVEQVDGRATVIADGGIKNSGDAVKALAAGADTVMVGRLLAGADEAPHGNEYFGMASKRVNGHNAPEGVEGTVSSSGPAKETMKELAWGIRSGVSYGGGTSLNDLRKNAEFVSVSPLTAIETGVRV